ncbi:MAG: mechanosensitive ion channel [Acidimicrobiales bacterium]|nr:mechanosensitive ion channel [Acidimicrobiales bacterium]
MEWLPSIVAVGVTIVVVFLVRFLESRIWASDPKEQQFRKQVYTALSLFLGMLIVIFLLPEGSNQDLAFGVIGLVVTGALAISSQSIIANGMAGILLRSLKKFKPGDFIEVSGSLGRVTELGLFHTEIQTDDRGLTTIPNALMVDQPVKVARASGTVVSATASLGYDVARQELTPLLLEAAHRAGLTEPFVRILDLGDYAVTYRVAGFLDETQKLLSSRSKLRGAILDCLHEASIEIMSPMYVATRNTDRLTSIPATGEAVDHHPVADVEREHQVFDKAELAGRIETKKRELSTAQTELADLANQLGTAGVENPSIRGKISARKQKMEHLVGEISELEELLRKAE